ncbi:hypothetical protein QJS10_CPB11g02006 [Acorus calamus]|uniref:Uncharacterized protein n=1 Tax=Acorus calamus TaxID=4465 RepID=A0AAV9DW33_ACOCL|nr:hypothetical protein QJS10_CPB11g02006 [Acorus calamus]
MDEQIPDAPQLKSRVKASLRLGSETYTVNASTGILSEQLIAMKEESMSTLKSFITKHNVPNDVPDEAMENESSSDNENTTADNPPKRTKQTK